MTARLASLALMLATLLPGLALAQTEQILTPSGTAAFDRVGNSVAVDGDRLLVGIPGDDQAGSNAGTAVLYEYANGFWAETATLIPPYVSDPQGAGYSVALDGDRAVLGAPYPNSLGGLAYVFDRINGAWVFTQALTATPQAPGIGVGWSVALDGDRVVLGTPGDDTGATDAGAVLVFDFANNAWTQTAVLRASVPTANSYLGFSVDVSGDRVIAGAPASPAASGTNAAYVFEKTANGWTEFILTDPNGASADRFGHAVAVDGPLAVVGAHRKTVANPQDGAAFVYEQIGNPWVLQAQLDGTGSHIQRNLGYSVDIEGSRVVIGAISTTVQPQLGAAFVYDGGASPSLTSRLGPSDGSQGDLFGYAVGASGPHVAVGAMNKSGAGSQTGGAYAYTDGPAVPFLLAQDAITIGKANALVGSLHANGDLTLNRQVQGYTGVYEADLTATGAISIDRRNVIDGNVTAGGALSVHPTATVTGASSGTATVAAIPLPAVAQVTPGTQNVTVTSATQTLAPGAYRRVRTEAGSNLTLTAGTYDLDRLQLRPSSVLTLDVSGGPITVQTATQLLFSRDVILKVTGTNGPDNGLSNQVTFRTAQATTLSIGARSFVVGTIEAPLALVRFRADVTYAGQLAAREIIAANRTTLWQHGAVPSLTTPSPASTTLPMVSSLTAPDEDVLSVAPNPLGDRATVSFSLAEAASVDLRVFDTRGREVAVLADGVFPSGAHTAGWDASVLPAGVYVLRLITPEETITRRITRVR
ncbi:MAG: T9SS type A sorting domain-containing protein [Bacteroidota bacterium]